MGLRKKLKMEIRILDKNNKEDVSKLIKVLNRAFLNRSLYSSINPYTKMTEEQLKKEVDKPDTWMYIMTEENCIVGCICCCYVTENGIKRGRISRVAVDPMYQGRGIARKLLEFVHEKAEKEGCSLMELSVGSVWKGAIGLYRRLGYKEISIVAHIPGTYWLINMMKPFSHYQCSEWKRKYKLLMSKCKFKILFYRDSTPNVLCRLIYINR